MVYVATTKINGLLRKGKGKLSGEWKHFSKKYG
jgi:hypothetical protein